MTPGSVRANESGFSATRGRSRTSLDRKLPPRAGVDWISGAPPSTVTLSATEPTSIEKFREITSWTVQLHIWLDDGAEGELADDHPIGSWRKVRNVVESFAVG